MDIGKRLRQARLEAGLSQRQLCADVITRNMLSQIENGSARPSMDTLVYLAGQLKKPVSYFLEEYEAVSANAACMANARAAYVQGRFAEAADILKSYQGPDSALDDEYGLLQVLLLLCRAEEALDRPIHARELLEEAKKQTTCYYTPELEQRRLLLLSRVSPTPVQLPVDDRPLLYRAEIALQAEDGERCAALLEACEDRESGWWHYLRGEAAFLLKSYTQAAGHYCLAEGQYPDKCWPKLEKCYQILGDYKLAYEYACKQR